MKGREVVVKKTPPQASLPHKACIVSKQLNHEQCDSEIASKTRKAYAHLINSGSVKKEAVHALT